jgi:uridine kinase
MVFNAIAIIAIVLLTSNAFGWILWALPVLLTFLDLADRKLAFLLICFSVFYTLIKGISSTNIYSTNFRLHSELNLHLPNNVTSLLFTALIVFSVFLIIRLLQQSVMQGDIYGLGKKPLAISISGDSGVGKDTLAGSLAELFGSSATSIISGDSYHLYERGDYVWGSHSHLNPRMNNLRGWDQDLAAAINRDLQTTRDYNHENGRFSNYSDFKKADLVISQGLHANYILVSNTNISRIHLEMDEALRIKLKLERDVNNRKHSRAEVLKQLKSRRQDHDQFILNQKKLSDINIKYLSYSNNLDNDQIELSSFSNPHLIEKIERILLSYAQSCIIRKVNGVDNRLVISASDLSESVANLILLRHLNSYDQLFPNGLAFNDKTPIVVQLICIILLDEKNCGKKRYIQ